MLILQQHIALVRIDAANQAEVGCRMLASARRVVLAAGEAQKQEQSGTSQVVHAFAMLMQGCQNPQAASSLPRCCLTCLQQKHGKRAH